jgi:SAM-dependent methyltransferase
MLARPGPSELVGRTLHVVQFRLVRPFVLRPLLRRIPRLRGVYWQRFYDLATNVILMDDGFTFLNLGYLDEARHAPPEPDAPDIAEMLSERLYERILEGVELKGRVILDVGSGRGGGCAYMARAHGPAHVIGVDASTGLVDWCTAHVLAPNVSFSQGRADALPMPDASVDVVTNLESAHCYASKLAFFREVHRVLRPGGSFAISDILYPSREVQRPGDVDVLLQRAGLVVTARSSITTEVLHARTAVSRSAGFQARLATLVRPWARASFCEGYCLPGSADFDAMQDGSLEYWTWTAEKPADAGALRSASSGSTTVAA